MAKIAAREGFSRARVTQIMNLLELPQEIQTGLLNPPARLNIHVFTERKLRNLASLAEPDKQKVTWRKWVRELLNLAPL